MTYIIVLKAYMKLIYNNFSNSSLSNLTEEPRKNYKITFGRCFWTDVITTLPLSIYILPTDSTFSGARLGQTCKL